MKKIKLKLLFAYCILSACILIINGCKKDCSNSGTTVNIGSTGGGTFCQNVATGLNGTGACVGVQYFDRIQFDNQALNFSIYCESGCSSGCAIMDCGSQDCPASCNGSPTASQVAYTQGHGYYGTFGDGHTVKFIASDYSDGSVTINYIFQ